MEVEGELGEDERRWVEADERIKSCIVGRLEFFTSSFLGCIGWYRFQVGSKPKF